MTKSKLVPILPIRPPNLEYIDGVLTKDSVEILEEDINWFINYAQQYLLALKTLSYEQALKLGHEIDFNKFNLKNAKGVDCE